MQRESESDNHAQDAQALHNCDCKHLLTQMRLAIEHQIENGKNAMPPYEGKLSVSEIDDVAAFVETQAEKGWTR